MLTRSAEWLELKGWQLAVGAMSAARRLGLRSLGAGALRAAHGFKEAAAHADYKNQQSPAMLRRLAHSWQAVAAGGWLLGLVLGYFLATL